MGITEMLLALLLGVVASLLAAEWLDWVPRLTEMAIRAAARRLPEKDRDRYHEEWSAVAEEIPGRLSRLLYSLDLIRASFAMTKQGNGTHALGMKRVFDIAFGGFVLVCMAPLIGFICWRVSRTGPIFDRVRCVGRSGKVFECLKFRTMVQNHQDVLTVYLDKHPDARTQWITRGDLRNDPRLTSIGVFLRRTSLDELPKFINVLRGEMSVVGPRLATVEEVEDLPFLGADLKQYIESTPGLTGPAQLTGKADRKSPNVLDLQYAANRSFWRDLVMVVRTVYVGFKWRD